MAKQKSKAFFVCWCSGWGGRLLHLKSPTGQRKAEAGDDPSETDPAWSDSSIVRSMDSADLVIVGGGAAGLAAAIASGERKGDRRIVILDGAKTLGAKILVSGGGRCNVTHAAVTAADFFGNRRIIKNVLAAWSVERTIEWFAGMGVELKREATGKLFPTTDKARTVLNALLERCHGLSVEIETGRRVSGIERADGRFAIHHCERRPRRKGGHPRDRRPVASEIAERWFGLCASTLSRSFGDHEPFRARATAPPRDDVHRIALGCR